MTQTVTAPKLTGKPPPLSSKMESQRAAKRAKLFADIDAFLAPHR